MKIFKTLKDNFSNIKMKEFKMHRKKLKDIGHYSLK
jgi:hypothetical protein